MDTEKVDQLVIPPEDSTKPSEGDTTTIPVITNDNESKNHENPQSEKVQTKENEEINGAEIDQHTEEMDVEIPVLNYWDYEIPPDFKPSNYLAVSSVEPSNRKKRLNFYKGCKWSPDGSCLLSNSDDDILRLYNVPESLYTVSDWNNYTPTENSLSMESVLKVEEGGQVYDYCWYPLMSSYDPVSCCFLTTSSDAPLHLWDAFTGKLRATYLAYDHLDQVVAAHSVAFDTTGQSIICGFNKMIRTFDITRPGRHCTDRKLKHAQITELSQPGIISCIAVNPALKSVMAVGSYLKTVGLYHDDGSVLCILQGHLGGVTHLKFSSDGTKLFSGGRKDSRLICWDMRYMGEHYTIFDRVVTTHQRIYFDTTPNGKYLVSGGTDGVVQIWDLLSSEETTAPHSSFQANPECINGVSVNPFIPLLVTSSGQRHVPKVPNYSDNEDDEEDSPNIFASEKNIKLWKFC